MFMKKILTLLLFIFMSSCTKSYDVLITANYKNGSKKYLDIFEVYGAEKTLIKRNY